MGGIERDYRAQPVPFIRRVRIRNYRSIAECDVTLGPLTVLLGFNAAGKSNFVDAIHFVADSLQLSPAQAAAERGGLETLLHRSPHTAAESFEIRLELNLGLSLETDYVATYGFTIGPDPTDEATAVVLAETGEVRLPDGRVSSLLFLADGHFTPRAVLTTDGLERRRRRSGKIPSVASRRWWIPGGSGRPWIAAGSLGAG